MKARGLNEQTALKSILKTSLFFSKNTHDIDSLLEVLHSVIRTTPAYTLAFSLNTKKSELLETITNDKCDSNVMQKGAGNL